MTENLADKKANEAAYNERIQELLKTEADASALLGSLLLVQAAITGGKALTQEEIEWFDGLINAMLGSVSHNVKAGAMVLMLKGLGVGK